MCYAKRVISCMSLSSTAMVNNNKTHRPALASLQNPWCTQISAPLTAIENVAFSPAVILNVPLHHSVSIFRVLNNHSHLLGKNKNKTWWAYNVNHNYCRSLMSIQPRPSRVSVFELKFNTATRIPHTHKKLQISANTLHICSSELPDEPHTAGDSQSLLKAQESPSNYC